MTFDGDIEYFFLRGEAGKEADARWRDAEVPRKGAGNGFVRLSLHRRFPDGDDVLTIVDLLNNFLPRPRLCVNDDFHSGCDCLNFHVSGPATLSNTLDLSQRYQPIQRLPHCHLYNTSGLGNIAP